jgi:POT family proton-dependent oligopeptide transporter
MSPDAGSPSAEPSERTLLGHPPGLFVLFFAELWERFCYYGMRALLALYIAKQFFAMETPEHAQKLASGSYGAFTALVYALGIFGGAIADRVLGYRRSIVLGGLIMATGMFMLMVPDRTTFFLGLAVMVVGNGLFKPNISSLVGKLYKQGDPRRDGGFTIFYMGINIGATLAPLACQWISERMGNDYRYGFMLAGLGMLLGLVCFGFGTKTLQGKGVPPPGKEGIGPIVQVVVGAVVVVPLMYFLLGKGNWLGGILFAAFGSIVVFLGIVATRQEKQVRDRMFVLVALLVLNILFWMGFEQSGNSLNFFAQKQLKPVQIASWTMPSEWWQSVNAVLIVLFGPIFSALWVGLDRRGLNPSIPRKFGFGLVGMGLGFLVLVFGIKSASPMGLVGWQFLLTLYLIHTLGELCLSPVGLSMVTKLAPEKMTGMVMGAWFISIATGNFLAGKFSEAAAPVEGATDLVANLHTYSSAFSTLQWIGIGVGAGLILVSPLVNRAMHGVK